MDTKTIEIFYLINESCKNLNNAYWMNKPLKSLEPVRSRRPIAK